MKKKCKRIIRKSPFKPESAPSDADKINLLLASIGMEMAIEIPSDSKILKPQ
jgi:hypothetical protein